MKRLAVHVDVNVDVARLCVWTAVTNGPVLPLPDYTWIWSPRGMILTGENRRTPSETLFTTDPTWKKRLVIVWSKKGSISVVLFMSVGRDYVSELRPLAGLLFVPQVIYEYGEPRWNDIDRFQPNNSEKNLYQYHFFHHKSHMDWNRAYAVRGRRLNHLSHALLGRLVRYVARVGETRNT
jgi:hypothetical protein